MASSRPETLTGDNFSHIPTAGEGIGIRGNTDSPALTLGGESEKLDYNLTQ